MFIKHRVEPKELRILRCLNSRMDMPPKLKNYYFNLEKGYEGERQLDKLLESLQDEWLILNDLLFESNNSIFQIDTLLISHNTAYVFEVKNYQGDFYIDSDIWYGISGNEIKNPLLQLKRSESLLRQLFHEHKISLNIETYLVFINSEFTLYKAPLKLPLIFPTQLYQFISKLKNLKISSQNKVMAEKLKLMHLTEQPFTRLPNYNFGSLKKGIACDTCKSLLTTYRDKCLVCEDCGYKEKIEMAIMRNVNLYRLLFSGKPVTTSTIHEWCKVVNKKKIREVLKKNLPLIGRGHSAYYLIND